MAKATLVPSRPTRPGRNLYFSRPVVAVLLLAVVLAASGLASAQAVRASEPAKALVLDPFTSQHAPGFSSQDVVALLQQGGFDVTYLENSDVSVSAMKHISDYAVVYVFTHAAPLPNSDAAVSTGDSRHQRYKSYFANSSLVQMHIHSDGGYLYFDAITGRFIQRYAGHFSPHSLVFINACSAIGMKLFWKYLKQAGVGTLISWAHHVGSYDADVAANDVLNALATGKTVSQAIKATKALGAGRSVTDKKTGILSYVGDGQNSFAQMTTGAVGSTR